MVPCKDTPNFIANRIGCFFGATIQKLTMEGDYTIEEVDALTGPLIGLPKSASYRLVDIIGLDVWAHVMRNLYELVPDDPWRDRFFVPEFMERMIERGWLGDKRGQGFYKRVGGQGDPRARLEDARIPPGAEAALRLRGGGAQHRRPAASACARWWPRTTAPARFLWSLFSDLFLYSAAHGAGDLRPHRRDRPRHALGLRAQAGAVRTVGRARGGGDRAPHGGGEPPGAGQRPAACSPPAAQSFYRAGRRGRASRAPSTSISPARRLREPRADGPACWCWTTSGARAAWCKKNAGASLVDLGDGVLCLEFHSKMNTLGDDAVAMICAGLDEAARNFQALVIANQGEHFSAGANLMLVLLAAQEGEWDELNAAVDRFQQANMAIKYAPVPVVAAPFGMTLGGGCEMVLHAARAQASAETYMGLVETGVGLIPAGGGCKEMLLRTGDAKKAFELIAYAKVSSQRRRGARSLGLLRPQDGISMNPERLVADAKALALALAPTWAPGVPRHEYPGGRRERLRAAENGRLHGARRRVHQRLRRGNRRKAGLRLERRPPDRASRPSPSSTCSIWSARRS